MTHVAVVSDNSCDVDEELARELGLVLAAPHVIVDRTDYRNRLDISTESLLEIQRRPAAKVSTAACSPGEYVAAYREALQRAPAVICTAMARRVSGTFDVCERARELLGQADITVVDSEAMHAGLGIINVAAAFEARAGRTKEEVLALVRHLIPRTRFLVTAETAEFMRRGGRLVRSEDGSSNLEGLRPIVSVGNSGWVVIGEASSRDESIRALLARMEHDLEGMPGWYPMAPIRAAIVHAGSAAEAAELRRHVTERWNCREVYAWVYGPAGVAHIGPGALGIAYQAL
ncbi:MAG: DegV family EDD domain-containing protein [Chloroflexi bacterium]|nr:DegV family EDD domain-containing protein [Chloroflexota bacterium]